MTSDLPILYSFRRCPYAMRARYAIAYSGFRCCLREVVLRDKPKSLIEYSPKGTVPILIVEGNTVIDESIDIIRHALTKNDPKNIMGISPEILKQAEILIENNDKKFASLLTKYKYFERYPEYTQAQYLSKLEHEFLWLFENKLANTKYLCSDNITIADIAIFPFIRQLAHVDREYFFNSSFTNLINWLRSFTDSDIFDKVMVKHDQWFEGDPITIFP